MNAHPLALSVTILTALLLPAGAAAATDPAMPAPQLLLTRSSVVPGSPVGNVASMTDVDITSGGWLAKTTTWIAGQYYNMVVANGQAGMYQTQDLGAGKSLFTFKPSLDRNASGQTSVVGLVDLGGAVYVEAVLVDGVSVLQQADALIASGVPAGALWSLLDGATITDDGRLVVLGYVYDPAEPGNDKGVLVSYPLLPDLSLGPATLLMGEGSVIDQGIVEWMPGVADMGWEVTSSGHVMLNVGYKGVVPGWSGPPAIVLNGVTLALDGAPSLVTGRDWILNSWSDTLDVAESGSWAFRAKVTGGFDGSLDVLVHDGKVLALEGQPLPGMPGTELRYSFAPRVSDKGQVLWMARFVQDNKFHEALFVDDQLVAWEGQLADDGHAIASFVLNPRQFDISPDGSTVLFTANRDDGEFALYQQTLGPWASLGGSLAGTGALTPKLSGHGSLSVGTQTDVTLFDAKPNTLAGLFLGFSQLDLPFKGGVLVPAPDVIAPSLPVNGSGQLLVTFPFPAGMPSGTSLWWQGWVLDAAAIKGFSATNCLLSETP